MLGKTNPIMNHLRDNAAIYIFTAILFLTGIIFGAIMVNSMNYSQKQDLYFFLERFFNQIIHGKFTNQIELMKFSFLLHAKYLTLFFILGLTIIGLPIVWILVFSKGIFLGFSVGFIVNQMGWNGFMLATISIAPQNLLIIPVYFIASSLSMIFSLRLIKQLAAKRNARPIMEALGSYTVLFACLFLLSFAAAAIEAFIANGAMESFIPTFHKKSSS